MDGGLELLATELSTMELSAMDGNSDGSSDGSFDGSSDDGSDGRSGAGNRHAFEMPRGSVAR